MKKEIRRATFLWKMSSLIVAEAEKWRNTEFVEWPKAKALAIRNTPKAVFRYTAKAIIPILTFILVISARHRESCREGHSCKFAMRVTTNKFVLLTRFQKSDTEFSLPLLLSSPSTSPASFGLLLGSEFRMPIFTSAPLRLSRPPIPHSNLWIPSCKMYKWMICVKY